MVVEVHSCDSSGCTCLLQAWVFLVSHSKPYLQQTSASEESVAQVQQIHSEIGRLNESLLEQMKKLKN